MPGDLNLNSASVEYLAQNKVIVGLNKISPDLANWAKEKFAQGQTAKEVKATIIEAMNKL